MIEVEVGVGVVWEEGADSALGLPERASSGAAGADLRANFPAAQREAGIVLAGGGRALVPTGLCLEIPEGYEIQIRPRSGLALRHGITLLNAPGTIDSDYRGPVGVILFNSDAQAFHITHGMRIAQMVLSAVVAPRFGVKTALGATHRGQGGFGSTGTG